MNDSQEMLGTLFSVEFVDDNDDEDRRPGTYITIRLDKDALLGAGRMKVSYIQNTPTSKE